jgi:alpha-L-fucosidase
MKKYRVFLLLSLVIARASAQNVLLPHPTSAQLSWQKMETTAFLHFTVNTFTDKEWGDGTESPAIFNPTQFDAEKIVKILRDAGFKMAIITAKHHDGFCLWPSKYTGHSVKNSPWKSGKGDVIKELSDACKKLGLKFGVYLSPWDRHETTYGTAAYNDYYKNQLRELLTNYGNIAEVWFDGAKGENAKNMEYDFKGFWQMVRQLQPGAVMFSDIGPDVRWVGNETGNAGETCWSTINTTGMAPGKADAKYLNIGDADGKNWIPAETDVSIRPGWFYHAAEDSFVKSGKNLMELYYQSVGRNSLLLLNIPPNRQGLFGDKDIASLKDFRTILDETFKNNLAANCTEKLLTDADLNTSIKLSTGQEKIIDFKKIISFNRIMLQENILHGQKNKELLLEYFDGAKWNILSTVTTIGYKRLLRFSAVNADKVRLKVLSAKQTVELAEIGFYKASLRE